ncbi:hypothetical protein PR202_gb20177 [Eleusine coracana subsp. coracana]|uniref:Elongator complex protein 1 n=1 Tax=Eleusine coracana subsp. coracana TaxID=191504 RepID=A0AAV5FBW9_ELECO|nr:hypothetical protein PR202_gb20177 [Eleusine coracana subsp. coracana]
MKNLRLVTRLPHQLQLQLNGETVVASSVDAERRRAFFASSANFLYTADLPALSAQGQQPLQWTKLDSDAEEVVLEPGDSVVAMDYLMERESLLLGSSSGCLLLYNVEDKTTQIVGRLEGGVSTIASSPDGALISVTTGFGQLLVITQDWEVLFETSLDPQISTAGETDCSGGQIQSAISWRGDGKFFATLGALAGSSNTTKLTIWERESGEVHSSSDTKTFMGTSLDWMPSGGKVATAHDRRTEGKCPLIVFFEKNGLERSNFSIDEPAEVVIQALKWNCNSELLAALVSSSTYDAIKIWSCSNNHWYLKHELRFTKEEGVKFTWDPTKPLHLICWTLGGQVIMHRFAWTTAVSETSIALVIDGSKVRVTPLNLGLMPPPMSLFHLAFPCAVNEVSFVSNYSKNHLAAYLTNGSLCVVELPAADTWEEFEGSTISVEPCYSDSTFSNCMHLTWIDTRTLISICCNNESCRPTHMGVSETSNLVDKHDSLFFMNEIELVCSEDSLPGSVRSSGWQARVSKKMTLDSSVIGVSVNPAKKGSAFIQLSGGRIVEYCSGINISRMGATAQIIGVGSDNGFPASCPWMTTVLCHENGAVRPFLFGLDDNSKLYMGNKLLSTNCSSFTLYSSAYGTTEQVTTHLLVTTKQDLLFIIDINDILLKSGEMAIDSHVSSHSRGNQSKKHITVWEKGAKLIGVLHGDEAAVIMQTNRGNLECTYPRKLVLVSIVHALVQRRFRDAMDMVRRHRIDFNIMIDYCGWDVFIKSAADFVKQVNNLGHITEFVCSIKNEDVSRKLYTAYISFPDQCADSVTNSGTNYDSRNKVNSVLMAIRKALEEQIKESSSRELCILTTLARSEPPFLEEALNRIKSIRELELLGLDDARRKLYPSAEESLKHLLWLTDPEAVYNAALGLYDLNLAAIVALNSQKDPKEFLPFLKSLECLPPAIMRYTVDLRLGRYTSALKSIVSAGDEYHDDCMKLLNANPQLFPLGLQLFTEPDKRCQIFEAWGDHLFEEKCFRDAALTYQCCSSYQKSLKACRECGDWRGVFTVAGLLKLKDEEIVQLAHELCEEFQEIGKTGDAARIALEYCSDVDRGVSYYMMAREWEEALRVSYMHSRQDLVETVRDAVLECAPSLLSDYQERQVRVGKYVARYVALRQRRLSLAAKLQSEDQFMDAEDDNISEVSTSFSEMSAYTTRSTKASSASVMSSNASKSRGPARQKKGGKIRAGSPGEEMALVEHLKGMALKSSERNELKNVLVVLLQFGKEEIARQVQQAGDNFEVSQRAAVKLAEDTVCDSKIDENAHTLEHYMRMLRALESGYSEESTSWRIKALSPA